MVRMAYAYCRAHLAVIAYLIVVVALAAGMYRVESFARATHGVLCDFKTDVQRRHDNTREFIRQIEHGERPGIPGIGTNDLERSADILQQTLESLSELEC